MKNNSCLLNLVFIVTLGMFLFLCVLVKSLFPGVILPKLDIPCITLISLVSLLAENFLTTDLRRNYLLVFAFSAVSFAVLPMAAGMAGAGEWWKLALAGGVLFTGTAWIFDSVAGRISSGNGSKVSVVITSVGILLAVQCFSGIIL